MAEKQFIVLYTHQKTKKAKTWHDGILKTSPTGSKVIENYFFEGLLYDDQGMKIDTIHVKPNDIIVGEQLESDRHYIMVEEEKTVKSEGNQNTNSQKMISNSGNIPSQTNLQKVSVKPTKIRTGLRRKRTGFVPPRMIRQPENNSQCSSQDSDIKYESSRTLYQSVTHQSDGSKTCLYSNNTQYNNSSSYREEVQPTSQDNGSCSLSSFISNLKRSTNNVSGNTSNIMVSPWCSIGGSPSMSVPISPPNKGNVSSEEDPTQYQGLRAENICNESDREKFHERKRNAAQILALLDNKGSVQINTEDACVSITAPGNAVFQTCNSTSNSGDTFYTEMEEDLPEEQYNWIQTPQLPRAQNQREDNAVSISVSEENDCREILELRKTEDYENDCIDFQSEVPNFYISFSPLSHVSTEFDTEENDCSSKYASEFPKVVEHTQCDQNISGVKQDVKKTSCNETVDHPLEVKDLEDCMVQIDTNDVDIDRCVEEHSDNNQHKEVISDGDINMTSTVKNSGVYVPIDHCKEEHSGYSDSVEDLKHIYLEKEEVVLRKCEVLEKDTFKHLSGPLYDSRTCNKEELSNRGCSSLADVRTNSHISDNDKSLSQSKHPSQCINGQTSDSQCFSLDGDEALIQSEVEQPDDMQKNYSLCEKSYIPNTINMLSKETSTVIMDEKQHHYAAGVLSSDTTCVKEGTRLSELDFSQDSINNFSVSSDENLILCNIHNKVTSTTKMFNDAKKYWGEHSDVIIGKHENITEVISDMAAENTDGKFPALHDDKVRVLHDDKLPVLHDDKLPVLHDDKLPVLHDDKLPALHDDKLPVLHDDKLPVLYDDKLPVLHDKLPVLHNDKLPVLHDDKLPVLHDDKLRVLHDDKLPVLYDDKLPVLHDDKLPVLHDDDEGKTAALPMVFREEHCGVKLTALHKDKLPALHDGKLPVQCDEGKAALPMVFGAGHYDVNDDLMCTPTTDVCTFSSLEGSLTLCSSSQIPNIHKTCPATSSDEIHESNVVERDENEKFLIKQCGAALGQSNKGIHDGLIHTHQYSPDALCWQRTLYAKKENKASHFVDKFSEKLESYRMTGSKCGEGAKRTLNSSQAVINTDLGVDMENSVNFIYRNKNTMSDVEYYKDGSSSFKLNQDSKEDQLVPLETEVLPVETSTTLKNISEIGISPLDQSIEDIEEKCKEHVYKQPNMKKVPSKVVKSVSLVDPYKQVCVRHSFPRYRNMISSKRMDVHYHDTEEARLSGDTVVHIPEVNDKIFSDLQASTDNSDQTHAKDAGRRDGHVPVMDPFRIDDQACDIDTSCNNPSIKAGQTHLTDPNRKDDQIDVVASCRRDCTPSTIDHFSIDGQTDIEDPDDRGEYCDVTQKSCIDRTLSYTPTDNLNSKWGKFISLDDTEEFDSLMNCSFDLNVSYHLKHQHRNHPSSPTCLEEINQVKNPKCVYYKKSLQNDFTTTLDETDRQAPPTGSKTTQHYMEISQIENSTKLFLSCKTSENELTMNPKISSKIFETRPSIHPLSSSSMSEGGHSIYPMSSSTMSESGPSIHFMSSSKMSESGPSVYPTSSSTKSESGPSFHFMSSSKMSESGPSAYSMSSSRMSECGPSFHFMSSSKMSESGPITYSMSSSKVLESEHGIHPISSSKMVQRGFYSPVVATAQTNNLLIGSKRNLSSELQFATKSEVEQNPVPKRLVQIPQSFSSIAVYRQIIVAALREHLNIILFTLAQKYHHSLARVDTSSYRSQQVQRKLPNGNPTNSTPLCNCGAPSKMIQVKKEGPNKGRLFYTCNAARNQQCEFFQWTDQNKKHAASRNESLQIKLSDQDSINTYLRGQHLYFFCECQFLKKSKESILKHFKKNVPKWVKEKYSVNNLSSEKKKYIRLSKKESSSIFSKDDLWVISKHLDFDPLHTFLARSVYYGPTAGSEVEIEPITSFSPSNWPNEGNCHCLLSGNVSSELSYLDNLQENLLQSSVPVLPYLLNRAPSDLSKTADRGFKPPSRSSFSKTSNSHCPQRLVDNLANEFVSHYKLNQDQEIALRRISDMFCNSEHVERILLIHGVFGSGKSYLLSVMIIFLVRMFEINDTYSPGVPYPWKVLVSSTTNVAVDRILLGLLELDFREFVRVGSMKKIAKPVLPFSVHATGTENQELKDLQDMLRSGELSQSEKHFVRQSIEKHRLGENKKRLGSVRVVGVTCASCSAMSLKDIKFPVVILDECSQMTEPASLLPIAKFGCERLVLVGDPKQLDPTIQGSEATHTRGLEQTLFDRLISMGHEPVVLHTQYRCHPAISRITNTLFYNGMLKDGIVVQDRQPLKHYLPTVCFYDVSDGVEYLDTDGSFSNIQEADFIVFMIEGLVSSGVDPGSIGVITLYKSQMYKIIAKLGTSRNCSQKDTKSTLVSTVDAFQGGEREIIILSCVRTKNVGFIDNEKRTNVALSRAKNHMLIVGHLNNLRKNQLWGKIINLCKNENNGIQQASSAMDSLQQWIDSEYASSETLNPSVEDKKLNEKNKRKRGHKRKYQITESQESSPPMSLSESQNTVPNSDPDSSYSEEFIANFTLDDDFVMPEFSEKIRQKKRRKLPLIDPNLIESDKENSSEEELPMYG